MTSSDPIGPSPVAAAGATTVPVIEERAAVSVRQAETVRARIRIGVSERDEAVQAMLMRQDVTVRRVPVGQTVAAAPPVRQEGDTIVVPILEERLVTETRLFLKEELHIRIDETRHAETQVVRLRSEHADVQHPSEGNPS